MIILDETLMYNHNQHPHKKLYIQKQKKITKILQKFIIKKKIKKMKGKE